MKEPKKTGSKKGSSKKKQIIVLVDGGENYYELPRATLERARVSEERKAEVSAALQDVPSEFMYIGNANIPGSIGVPPFQGGRQIHYAGFYLKSG
jgi:hypothetical protein